MSPTPPAQAGLIPVLKHVLGRLHEVVDEALAPLGVDGRDFGVLVAVAERPASSQQQVAAHLGIDRTSMVARLDTLEGKGLVARRPDPEDRRRNVVELTPAGERLLRSAASRHREAETAFLEPLGTRSAQQLRRALDALLG